MSGLPRLNITNDVPARSPAECAAKCRDSGNCELAGFIPSPSGVESNGVCLLTSDMEMCPFENQFVPQHASLTPFVVSCIRCSGECLIFVYMTGASGWYLNQLSRI